MKCLEIKATIPIDKKLEFDQTKVDFVNRLSNHDGYLGFKEDIHNDFRIVVSWDKEENLNKFIDSTLFHFFTGALQTIATNRNIKTYNYQI